MNEKLTDKEIENEQASSYVDFLRKVRKIEITTSKKEPVKKGAEIKSNFVRRSE
jgi:hypothetical protein